MPKVHFRVSALHLRQGGLAQHRHQRQRPLLRRGAPPASVQMIRVRAVRSFCPCYGYARKSHLNCTVIERILTASNTVWTSAVYFKTWETTMPTFANRMFHNFAAKFGHCPRCMRQSAAFCIASWTVFAVTLWFCPPQYTLASGALAAIASALFISHIAVYALRAVIATERDAGRRLDRRLALQAVLGATASALLIVVTNEPASAAKKKLTGSACGGWHGECEPCQRNTYLNQDPKGCLDCQSCSRSGRACQGRC